MDVTEKQEQKIEGIIHHLSELLDKRFSQARRVNPRVAVVEADVRWHMMQTIRDILSSSKGFGPLKFMVCDILSSTDEAKKRDLFNPVDQASIMNEIIPEDNEGQKQKRSGQLAIHNIKTFYSALDPSLEKILLLVQTWIWWDMRDAADQYRFDVQINRFKELRSANLTPELLEFYHQEMNIKSGIDISVQQILMFEINRTKEILDMYRQRRTEEHGYQMILYCQQRSESNETDAACIRLAKRLMAIAKVKAQPGAIDANVRQYYGSQLGLDPSHVTADAILDFEDKHARRERQTFFELLSRGTQMGETANYKTVILDEMDLRFNALCASLKMTRQALEQNAPEAVAATMPSSPAPASQPAQPAPQPTQFQIPNF